jgi:hypothetical protein
VESLTSPVYGSIIRTPVQVLIRDLLYLRRYVVLRITAAESKLLRTGFDAVVDQISRKLYPVDALVHITARSAENFMRFFPVNLESVILHQIQSGFMYGVQIFVPKYAIPVDVLFVSEFAHFLPPFI